MKQRFRLKKQMQKNVQKLSLNVFRRLKILLVLIDLKKKKSKNGTFNVSNNLMQSYRVLMYGIKVLYCENNFGKMGYQATKNFKNRMQNC
jgi:hypothetical protein